MEFFFHPPGLGILSGHVGFLRYAASGDFRPFPKSESAFSSSNWKGRRYHGWLHSSKVVNLSMPWGSWAPLL